MQRKKILFVIAILITLAAVYLIVNLLNKNNSKLIAELNGKWGGLLVTPNNHFIIYAEFSNNDNNLDVKISSPQQRKYSINVDSLVLQGNTVSFKIPDYSVNFSGEIIEDSSKITGNWKQGKITSPLIFYRADELYRINRPQHPFKPFGYISDTVEIASEDSINLAGTFTYPNEENSKYPAMILINGLGKQDRDATMYGHKPFLVLSDFFTKNSYAVLRVDDRGVGESTGNFNDATLQNFSKDVDAEINFIQSKNNIDTTRIGLIGFGEGGLVAALAASQNNSVDFIVLLSTPGVSGKEIQLDQTQLLQKKANIPADEIDRDYKINEKMFNIVKNNQDTATVKTKLKKVYKNFLSSLPESERFKKKYSVNTFQNLVNMLITPWFKDYLTFNPEKLFEKIKCPVLIIYGENDLQVDPNKNLKAIETALKTGGNKNFKSIIFPELNHLLQHSKDGFPTEYSKIEETFSTEVMDSIDTWSMKL